LQHRAKITRCSSHNLASKVVHLKSSIFSHLSEGVGRIYPLRPYFSLSEHVTGTTITFKLTNNLITCFHNSSIIGGRLFFSLPKQNYWEGLEPPSPQVLNWVISTPMLYDLRLCSWWRH